MHPFSRLFCILLANVLLLACSENNHNNSNTSNLVATPEPPVVTPPEPPTSIFSQATVNIPSAASPAFTPGTPGVTVDNEKLLRQFGSTDINLNQASYTRYFLSDKGEMQPDGIVVLIPGFEGGAATFYLLAENLLRRAAADANLILEVWAVDRRSNQLEDTVGLDIAEELQDPLVHSQDIDAVIDAAHSAARSGNVFLGGHSAGTAYTARYAATDFNLSGGTPDPGYEKLRGLILLGGTGASLSADEPDEATLGLIEARFDGGLYGAVRDQMPRCIDGQTARAIDTAATDCAAFDNTSCVEPELAFSVIPGLLSTQLLTISEVAALDASLNDDTVASILQRDFNEIPGNNVIAQVPELSILTPLVGNSSVSSVTLLGKFLDDDGLAAAVATIARRPRPSIFQ